MARTVDDFWIVTPEGTDHGELTVQEFEKAFGPGVVVKRGAAASEYAGYTIAQSLDRSRMPAARREMDRGLVGPVLQPGGPGTMARSHSLAASTIARSSTVAYIHMGKALPLTCWS